MMFWKRVMAVTFIAVFISMTIAGCNTVRGMGKDVERGGEKIQEAVQ